MLILTGYVGETLLIGGDIQVTVLGLQGKQIRMGVAAPQNLVVRREKNDRQLDNKTEQQKQG